MNRTLRWAVWLAWLLAATSAKAAGLSHDVYVWQRLWTPAHVQALADSRTTFAQLRVLAAQWHPAEGLVRARIDLDVLHDDGRAVVAVLRADGAAGRFDVDAIADELQRIAHVWGAAGIRLAGFEIDHDAASARLDEYARGLAALRARLPSGLSLSITALPAWTSQPALVDLLGEVDDVVLQLHAVDAPRAGLFDPSRAAARLQAFAAVAKRPFRIALPAYGAALVASGGDWLIESETTLAQAGDRIEIDTDPREVAAFLRTLEATPPTGLVGVSWFRLPLPGDRRVWPLRTLAAVVAGEPLAARLSVLVRDTGAARDVVVRNEGTLMAPLPRSVRVRGACPVADALDAYRLERSAASLRFIADASRARIAPAGERVIGWIRCAQESGENVDVDLEPP